MLGRTLEKRAWNPGWPPFVNGDTVPSPAQSAGFGGFSMQTNQNAALKVSAVWAAVRIVADAVAMAPIDVYRKDKDVRVNLSTPPVFATPALPPTTIYDWKFAQVAALLLTGNAYLVKGNLDRLGYPSTLEMLDPTKTRPVPDNGRPPDHYLSSGVVYAPDEIIHIRSFVVAGRTRGVSPLEIFGATIGRASEAEAFGERFFADGCVPSGIVYSDEVLNPEEAKGIKAAIVAAWRGRREPAVLGAGLKYEKVSVAPGESQMLEIEQFSVEQIARIFGVDPTLIGHAMSGSSITYANIEQRAIGFQQWTVLPWATRLETAWSNAIARGQFVKLNLDVLIRVDLITRYTAHGKMLRDGWGNANEVRALEDLGPIPHGDEYLWPLLPKQSDAAPEGPGGTVPGHVTDTPVAPTGGTNA